jgi:DNA adenine methylase
MVKHRKVKVSPFQQALVVPEPAKDMTSLSYYGGKLRDADWVISQFPPHKYYIEVFGGGGAVFFAKSPSENDVYNDAGNVAVFWRVVQAWGDELYEKLFWSPYSREEFFLCVDTWEEWAERSRQTGEKTDLLEFARRWFVAISLSYSHGENDRSFKLAVQVNNARGLRNHIDCLLVVAERLRNSSIEHLDFRDCIRLYDRADSLFYMDPPYVPLTRVSNGTYRCEMSVDDHIEMLELAKACEAQVIISGYDSELYNEHLKGWRIVRKTAPSAIQNRKQVGDRGDRTEVLWIKERTRSLWSLLDEDQQQTGSPSNVAGVPDQVIGETESLPVSQ